MPTLQHLLKPLSPFALGRIFFLKGNIFSLPENVRINIKITISGGNI